MQIHSRVKVRTEQLTDWEKEVVHNALIRIRDVDNIDKRELEGLIAKWERSHTVRCVWQTNKVR